MDPVGLQVGRPMIGLNTHILLRLWLDDDPAQNREAAAGSFLKLLGVRLL